MATAQPETKSRRIGLLPAEFAQAQEKLRKGEQVFITTKDGVKEEITLTEKGTPIVKNTGTLIVDSEEFMKMHKISETSNWNKLIMQHGPPVLRVGLIAYFMNKESQNPIMINTLTDEIMENILTNAAG